MANKAACPPQKIAPRGSIRGDWPTIGAPRQMERRKAWRPAALVMRMVPVSAKPPDPLAAHLADLKVECSRL
jgi:hypothetical protein